MVNRTLHTSINCQFKYRKGSFLRFIEFRKYICVEQEVLKQIAIPAKLVFLLQLLHLNLYLVATRYILDVGKLLMELLARSDAPLDELGGVDLNDNHAKDGAPAKTDPFDQCNALIDRNWQTTSVERFFIVACHETGTT